MLASYQVPSCHYAPQSAEKYVGLGLRVDSWFDADLEAGLCASGFVSFIVALALYSSCCFLFPISHPGQKLRHLRKTIGVLTLVGQIVLNSKS